MSELVTGITNQANFPKVDLSDDNATLLELMMSNVGILRESHEVVERASWIFRVGHATILHSAKRVYDEGSRMSAVNHGVTTFEAITAMVGGIAAVSDPTPVNRQSSRLTLFDPNELGNYIDSALDSFRSDMARTAEVVRSSSSRFHGPLTSYAILGAAMSRQFELDSVA
jgi:hypothetical protein